MIVLLPPSEGKRCGGRGRPVDLTALTGADALTDARQRVAHALVGLCAGDRTAATSALGLGPSQGDDVGADARVLSAPTVAARDRYTGVLFAALDLPSLPAAAQRRALVFSGLFGVVRPGDRIPWYRLPGAVSLPGLGTVAGVWRQALAGAEDLLLGRRGVTVDLRSGTYASFWRPSDAGRVVGVKVLTETADGRVVSVSHDNKSVKGRLARALLLDPAGTVDDVAQAAAPLGRGVEVVTTRSGPRVDVVVAAADLRPPTPGRPATSGPPAASGRPA